LGFRGRASTGGRAGDESAGAISVARGNWCTDEWLKLLTGAGRLIVRTKLKFTSFHLATLLVFVLASSALMMLNMRRQPCWGIADSRVVGYGFPWRAVEKSPYSDYVPPAEDGQWIVRFERVFYMIQKKDFYMDIAVNVLLLLTTTVGFEVIWRLAYPRLSE
jgi:hypothetical protein